MNKLNTSIKNTMIARHFFNNITYTKNPFQLSVLLFFIVLYFILYINKYIYLNIIIFNIIFIIFLSCILKWISQMYLEAIIMKRYNKKIITSIFTGFLLFLLSEIMLFSGFFWVFFDRIFHISIYTFNITHSLGITNMIYWFYIPYIATLILVYSGYTCNYSYYLYESGFQKACRNYLLYTIFLAYIFLYLQYSEYTELSFNISDNIYTSIFYLLTGFHGMHVIIGFVFLSIQLIKIKFISISYRIRILSFAIALIYWHFVDIIWLFLYIFVYFLNNNITYTWIIIDTSKNNSSTHFFIINPRRLNYFYLNYLDNFIFLINLLLFIIKKYKFLIFVNFFIYKLIKGIDLHYIKHI